MNNGGDISLGVFDFTKSGLRKNQLHVQVKMCEKFWSGLMISWV